MARRVFFSFHYARDIRRIVQVRNSWVVRMKEDAQPFLDKAQWETVERTKGVEKWIEEQLFGTSVTVVLIGAETSTRRWVLHEIRRSHELGKGLLGIYVQNIKDPQLGADRKGMNPFDKVSINVGGRTVALSTYYPTYDWVLNDGYTNLKGWIEAAAKAAGR